MAHVRTQIRSAAVSALTGLATTGPRVFASRALPITKANMPGICVYTQATVRENLSSVVDLICDVYAFSSGSTDWEDTADQADAEIEKALYETRDRNSRFLGALALDLEQAQSDKKYIGDAEVPYGVLRIIYKVRFKTMDGDAETAL